MLSLICETDLSGRDDIYKRPEMVRNGVIMTVVVTAVAVGGGGVMMWW